MKYYSFWRAWARDCKSVFEKCVCTFPRLLFNQILWSLKISEGYSAQNFRKWDLKWAPLVSVFSILKPLMAGILSEIKKGIQTSKRFHLKTQHNDNLISHSKTKLTGWCKFWQLFLGGFVKAENPSHSLIKASKSLQIPPKDSTAIFEPINSITTVLPYLILLRNIHFINLKSHQTLHKRNRALITWFPVLCF